MNTSKLKIELAKNKTIKHLIHFDSVSSTNDYVKKNYKKLKHGTVVLADEQTKGRGRFENKWFSPKGKGLYFSVLLKPRRDRSRPVPTIELLNLIPAYAVLKTLYELFDFVGTSRDLSLQLKYPNDILINGKKIGGVLVETKFTSRRDRSRPVLTYAVMGIGLNVNGKPSDFPIDIRKTSAFISEFINPVVYRHACTLLINIIKNLEHLIK